MENIATRERRSQEDAANIVPALQPVVGTSLLLHLLLILLLCTSGFAQAATSQQDTLTVRDTTAAAPRHTVTGIDTLINYSAGDSIVYSIRTRMMTLYGKSNITYQQMQLRSERIDVDWTSATLYAVGIDSTDSTGVQKKVRTPVMRDAGEEYHGKELAYNFRTRRGRIVVGETVIDQGYYHGENIKRVDQKTLFVEDGRYTTCDLPEPHYFFLSPKMKVTMQDKVIAERVYLYIADVPLFALPFGVFPNQRGRRSGIIAPAYGEDARRGRFLSHLGYYWAISEYMDMNVRSDLFTRGGYALYSDYRYALRYQFTGSVSGEYRRLHTGEASDPGRTDEESYRATILHNQEIDPTMRFNVNFTFASNNSFRNTIDLRQALDQSITSNATISKQWEGTPNSMSLNVSRRQNLINGGVSEVLPSMSFNHSQSYPLRFGRTTSSTEYAWYEMIGLSYRANASNSRTKSPQTVTGIRTSMDGADTVVAVKQFGFDRTRSLSQDVAVNIAPKLGYFTISPQLSYSDQRTFLDQDIPGRSTDSMLIVTNRQTTTKSGTLSSGLGIGTKLYGFLQPGIFGIESIRHTLQPSLSITYRNQIVGNSINPRQVFASLNVGNLFEMKTRPTEEGKEPDRIQLLNAGAGVSYNFTADSLNFSPIGVNYRTGIGQRLDVGGSASFDLYQLVQVAPDQYVRVNRFLINEEGRLARLTNFTISVATSLSGEATKRATASQSAAGDTMLQGTQPEAQRGYYGIFGNAEEPNFSIPWRLSLALDYSESKVPPSPFRSANIRGSLEFNLTENWKISGSGGYDLVNSRVVVPNINVTRDLHCWIMNFSWVPTGLYKHYMFEIRVKAPQLQDVKVTKQGSERGIY
jgi:lipopolysaccharide assembly outer membrane protein LptD (OstA)